MNMKKQQGMSLIGALLTLAIISAAIVPIAAALGKWSEQRVARHYATQVEGLIDKIQQYQYYRTSNQLAPSPVLMWPASLNALVTDYNSEFWAKCSTAESQQGLCKRPEYTPFGGSVSYQVIDGSSSQLTIPTSITGDKKRVWTTALLKIPFTKVKTNGDVEIKIAPPLQSLVYDGFVQRDGSTSMTGDWDIGNHAILNAKAVSARNSDGSQRWLSGGSEQQIVKHGDSIKKPACPGHLTPDLKLAIAGIYTYEAANDFNEVSKFRAYTQNDYASSWVVALDYYAFSKTSQDYKVLHDGDVLAVISCKPKP